VSTSLAGTALSVLDLAPVPTGSGAPQALAASTRLARHAERLGYRRHWVAEHHNMPGIASSAPAVLMAHLAAATETLRIGSGGVMLPNHPPLVVAEQFGMLEALHPGRIDLGIGRAPGTDQVTAAALRRATGPLSADDFPQQLTDLLGFLDGGTPLGPGVRAFPAAASTPEIWLLGSSGYSAQVAGLLGLPFAFAHHFSAENTEPAVALYRQSFRPSPQLTAPHLMVCVSVTCADTDDEAQWLAGSMALSMLRLRAGQPGLLPTPQQAADYPYTEAERAAAAHRQASQAVGSPATVRTQLEQLLARTGADELMVTTVVHDPDARLRSYELLATAARLPAAERPWTGQPVRRTDTAVASRAGASPPSR
jgi:luciferase family oxidoreductase group 1